MLLAHADRFRIVADDLRRRIVVVAKRVQRVVLRHGFVSGTWTLDPGPYGRRATVVVRLPGRVTTAERTAAEAEVARLGELLSPRGTTVDGPVFTDLA
ncbi:MAG: crosslink repair DNA glycosylase YcaQ family protein [Micromonosporaceae bacterium]